MTGAIHPRTIPYPFEGMLALCSDLDETTTKEHYWRTARYLNTTEHVGDMGEGVGLETGNSIYFDMPPDQFAYWNTDDEGREMVRALIRSGHIDCFHSFGDRAVSRADAVRSLTDLDRHQCRLHVWVDHATAATNFGGDIMRGHGDEPGHAAYHADLTFAHGLRYVWRGRVTTIVGQNAARSYHGVLTTGHPFASLRTLGKEFAKGALARFGNAKYAMHGPNDVLRSVRLRDDRRVLEFLRCNPHWLAVDRGETADGLAEVLTARTLDALVSRRAVSIVYTHLGKTKDPREPLNAATRAALHRLADYQRFGRILVTTTRRILDYCRALRELTIQSSLDGAVLTLDIARPPAIALEELAGITIDIPQGARARVLVDGRETDAARLNPPDRTGRPSVSFPWPKLSFPAGPNPW